jgi:hypothetical protein
MEFEPKHETRGHEQLYCSTKCRTEAYKKRSMEKMKINGIEEQHTRTIDVQRSDYSVNPNGSFMPNVNLEILEGKYQAKTEALEYKLKYEQAVKELEQAKQKIFELEQELDEDDVEEDNNGFAGIISGLTANSPAFSEALGTLLKHDKVQRFVLSIIPDVQGK